MSGRGEDGGVLAAKDQRSGLCFNISKHNITEYIHWDKGTFSIKEKPCNISTRYQNTSAMFVETSELRVFCA